MQTLYRIADSTLAGALLYILLFGGLGSILSTAIASFVLRRTERWRAAQVFHILSWAVLACTIPYLLFWGEVGKARSQNTAPSVTWLVVVAGLSALFVAGMVAWAHRALRQSRSSA